MSKAEEDTNRPHPQVELRRDGAVVVLRIDREEALGALSGTIVRTLGEVFDQLAADRTVRVLVVTGTGRGFIAGADITEYHNTTQQAFEDYQHLSRKVFDRLESLPQITIAAVNGYALGGGFELALCCDLIVASARARFGLPEINLGLLPGGGGTQRLARAAGARLTKELVLTGRFASADELHRRGVVAAVHEPDGLASAALELAHDIAAKAPLAAAAAKRLIDDGLQAAQSVGLTAEQQILCRLFATEDGKEGVAAFVDKRPARFTGR
jgi:enoyl-CoA hydratase